MKMNSNCIEGAQICIADNVCKAMDVSEQAHSYLADLGLDAVGVAVPKPRAAPKHCRPHRGAMRAS